MRSEKGEFDVEWRGMNGEEGRVVYVVKERLGQGINKISRKNLKSQNFLRYWIPWRDRSQEEQRSKTL